KLRDWLLHPSRRHQEWKHGPARRRDVWDLLRLGLVTTMRIDEMLSLRWSDIKLAQKKLRVYSMKTRRERFLPITPALEALLEERWAIHADGKLFPYDFITHYTALRGVLLRACE